MSDLQIGQGIYRVSYVEGLESDLDRERTARRVVDEALRQSVSFEGALENLRKAFDNSFFYDHDRELLKKFSEMIRIIYDARLKQ